MADCTGYGFGSQVFLCLLGPVGNGRRANLQIRIQDTSGQNWNSSASKTVSNWDGTELTVDVTELLRENGSYHFVGVNCDVTAQVTITPNGGDATGTVLLEYLFNNCAPNSQAANKFGADVFENCGGAGPHVVSEMTTVTFDGLQCV